MRRSDEDEYSARYASADSVAQWSSYATHNHGVALPSSNVRGSMSGAGSGYDNAVGTGHGMWMSHGHNNSGGSYPRQDQSMYAQHNPNPGYHSSTSQRAQEQWCTPSGNYGRHGMEQSNPRTSASQPTWEQHHNHGRSNTYAPYDDGSNYTPFSSSTQQPSPPTGEIHNYIALPSTPQSTVESYLAPVKLPDTDPLHKSKRAYQCTWTGCSKAARGELFKSKDNARVHVHKHFGSDKLFECVVGSCRKTFASEDAAKRHRDTTESKAFSCAVCGKVFARKDYRDVHQRRCTA